MYERFTDRARKCMQLANQEAQRFNHEYIGTEHILLGLVKEGAGVAAMVFKGLDIDLRKIRLEVEKLVQSGPDMVPMAKLPQTPRSKKVIAYAIEAAREMACDYVGTEHLLLGLVRETEGVARNVLENLGITTQVVCDELGLMLNKDIAGEHRGINIHSTSKHLIDFNDPLQNKIEEAIENQDFEEAIKLREIQSFFNSLPVQEATEDNRKETLRLIICAILGNLNSKYGDKVTLLTIKGILDERGTD